MNVLLLQLDGSLPNLALMRVAAHHRAAGDRVELRRIKKASALQARLGDPAWDRVYGSLIFEKTRPLARAAEHVYPGILLGGTGWSVTSNISDVGIDPDGPIDYTDYPRFKRSLGFAMRGCRLRCSFCVVPRKEGRARSNATIAQIWRGDPWPREILLLDNDFFGNPTWRDVWQELKEGAFKVSFVQGINARMLNDETAAAIVALDYKDDGMKRKRIYTAWDSKGDERTLFRGLKSLTDHGVHPDQIMVYMLIGEAAGETAADREYRRIKLREFGCRPYPMPYERTAELVAYQRFVIQRHDKHVSWDDFWGKAKGEPRKLGPRRVTLPLFPDAS